MKRFSRSSSPAVLLCAAVILSACGGARPIPNGEDEAASSEEGGEGRRSRRRADRDREDGEEGGGEEYPLDPPATVAGTGIRIRPPRGSERSAMGSTFIHPRRRIQIVIAAAEGDLSVHQQFRAGLLGDADEIESQEIDIDGATGHLVVDRMEQGDVELERVWVIARRGTRSVAAMGVYQAERSETMRGLLRASVTSLQFDETVPIDPEAAVGWRLDPIEGLQLVRTASTSVSYSVDGQPPENGTGAPMVFLVPLPIEVPEEQRATICAQILDQLVQMPEGTTADRQAIDAGEVKGCDLATTSGESETASYAALVFRGPAAFMVGASVASAQRDPWIARFRAAARTLNSVRPAGGDAGGEGADGETGDDER